MGSWAVWAVEGQDHAPTIWQLSRDIAGDGLPGGGCDAGRVAWIQLVDEAFIVAAPAAVAEAISEERRWRLWWPDLRLQVFMDRGVRGIRWSVLGPDRVGSLELWLEAWGDGVLVHHYQRLDPAQGDTARVPAGRVRRREQDRRVRAWKKHMYDLKDSLEVARTSGDSG